MIDTLKMFWPEGSFAVSDDHKLTIQPASYRPSSGEIIGNFQLWKGTDGTKAYCNTPDFQMEVKAIGAETKLLCKLSLPKYGKGDNFSAVSERLAVEKLKDLQKQMNDNGVKADISEAKLSRIDLFKNVFAEHSFKTYSPVFGMLEAKRMKSMAVYGGDCFLWGSTKQQICAYDKVEEMRNKQMDVRKLEGSNVLRFENRLFGAEKIAKVTGGMITGKDFLSGYGTLKNIYHLQMKNNLFRYEPDSIEVLNLSEVEATLTKLKKLFPRKYLFYANRMMGVAGWMRYGKLENVAEIVEKVSGHRQTKKKWLDSQRRSMFFAEGLSGDAITIPVGTLYREISEKVLKVA